MSRELSVESIQALKYGERTRRGIAAGKKVRSGPCARASVVSTEKKIRGGDDHRSPKEWQLRITGGEGRKRSVRSRLWTAYKYDGVSARL